MASRNRGVPQARLDRHHQPDGPEQVGRERHHHGQHRRQPGGQDLGPRQRLGQQHVDGPALGQRRHQPAGREQREHDPDPVPGPGHERLGREHDALQQRVGLERHRVVPGDRLPVVAQDRPAVGVQDGGVGPHVLGLGGLAEQPRAGQRPVDDVELERERERDPHDGRDDEQPDHHLAGHQLAQGQEEQSRHGGGARGRSRASRRRPRRTGLRGDWRTGSTASTSTPSARKPVEHVVEGGPAGQRDQHPGEPVGPLGLGLDGVGERGGRVGGQA